MSPTYLYNTSSHTTTYRPSYTSCICYIPWKLSTKYPEHIEIKLSNNILHKKTCRFSYRNHMLIRLFHRFSPPHLIPSCYNFLKNAIKRHPHDISKCNILKISGYHVNIYRIIASLQAGIAIISHEYQYLLIVNFAPYNLRNSAIKSVKYYY